LNQIPAALVVKGFDIILRSIVKEELLVRPSHYNTTLRAIDSQIKRLTEAQEVEADSATLVDLMIVNLGSRLKHISTIAASSRLQCRSQGFTSRGS
jgi:hypothetical protein